MTKHEGFFQQLQPAAVLKHGWESVDVQLGPPKEDTLLTESLSHSAMECSPTVAAPTKRASEAAGVPP